MPSHPKDVHPLRSRLVFFLRDWSLTLFLLPLFLLGWSFWMLPLIAASTFADSRLQKLYAEFNRSSEAAFEWHGVRQLQIQLSAAIILVIVVAALAYDFRGATYAVYIPAIAFFLSAFFDPRSRINIRDYPNREPFYRGQIVYPGMGIVGPLSLMLVSELARAFSIWAMLAGNSHPLIPFIAGVFGAPVPICYWIGAFVVTLNDELRLLKSEEGNS